MKNILFMPLIAFMVFAVVFTSGCTTGQFVSMGNETGDAPENAPIDSSDGFVIEANIVLDDNISVINDTGNVTDEEGEIIENVTPSSSGSSGRSSNNSPPPTEPEEFLFTVYIDSTEPVRAAEFGLSFIDRTCVEGNAEVGEFLKKDGTSVTPYVSKKDTYILVGLLRDINIKTGVSGSGELGTVTFFGYPEDVKLVHAKVMGENINGTIQNKLDIELSGNTIYVQ